jgi:hypothetical protein
MDHITLFYQFSDAAHLDCLHSSYAQPVDRIRSHGVSARLVTTGDRSYDESPSDVGTHQATNYVAKVKLSFLVKSQALYS